MTKKPPLSPGENEERLRRQAERRGQKPVTLAALSKMCPPDSDVHSYFAVVHGETDRGLVIMGSALLENALTKAIRSGAPVAEDKIIRGWFDGPNAPFGSFGAKIQLGRVLAIYGPQMTRRLTLIKGIRNAFAHSAVPLDFDHPTIEAECKKLSLFKPTIELKRNIRLAFLSACIGLARNLESYAKEVGDQPRTPRYP